MRAAGYIRVSTQEQATNGWNLDEDRKLIEARCEREGWELVAVHDDGGRQGDDPNRPGLHALLDSLDGLDIVIVRQQDRISRDPVIWGTAAALFRGAGVRVLTFTAEIDLDTPQGRFMAGVFAQVGQLEKEQTGQRVKQALAARASAGLHTGGAAPYGYRWEQKLLVIVPAEAEVVRRIFADYLSGRGQRAITRALNDEAVPTRHGGPWRQSAMTRILGDRGVIYTGKLRSKTTGEVRPGIHEPIISDEIWSRAEQIRSGASRRKGGRHADGAHLLTRGILKCSCGSAMVPRKARPGVERERYVCSGRIADPQSCSQPSIRRELIDEPFLAHLLDGYLDIEATIKRIEERTASALMVAREALTQAEREALAVNAEARLARVKRGWQDSVIDDAEYQAQRGEIEADRAAAQAALERARDHVRAVEHGGVPADAERVLLDHLAALKRAASAQADAAPDLNALRNVIGDMFDSVTLAELDEGIALAHGGASGPGARSRVPVEADGRYWLLAKLRWSSVDEETLSPIGHEIPVPEWQSYPHGFLSRYCW